MPTDGDISLPQERCLFYKGGCLDLTWLQLQLVQGSHVPLRYCSRIMRFALSYHIHRKVVTLHYVYAFSKPLADLSQN